MTTNRPTPSRPSTAATTTWRLDRLTNPYGPIDRVMDDVAQFDGWSGPIAELEQDLRFRLGARTGVPASWVVLANGIDELHAMISRWRDSHGPAVTFAPTDPEFNAWLSRHYSQIEVMPRGKGFSIATDAIRLPHRATSVVLTPNDPTGTIMTVQEAVSLSRLSGLVVIDERHAAYSTRTLQPLVREFDNLVVLQTMETYAGLTAFPLAWAVAPPPVAAAISEHGRPSGIASMAVVAGLAALDADSEILLATRQIAVEKGRLYRQLRKLSMISPPYPSWSNFLLARFERGSSDFFLPRLKDRGIFVHEVTNRGLANHVRVSAVSLEATYALKHALIEIALDL